MRPLIVIVALLSVLAGAAPASGIVPRFLSPRSYDPPGEADSDLAVGDFNRDGRSDVVVAGASGPNQPVGSPLTETSLFLAGADGQLSAPRALGLPGGLGVVLGTDVDGDGSRDIVRLWGVCCAGGGPRPVGQVGVLFGVGGGAFSTATVSRFRCCSGAAVAADFNGDQKADLAVAGYSATLAVFGNGAGTFERPLLVGHRSGSSVEPFVADLNRDRMADLVVRHGAEEPHGATAQLGDGNGHFSAPRSLPTSLQNAGVDDLVIGRLNGDRWPDVAAVMASYWGAGHWVRVFLGTGSTQFRRGGRFGIGSKQTTYYGAFSIEAADLDGDNNRDLAIIGPNRRGETTVRTLTGTGTGTFRHARTVKRCCGHSSVKLKVAEFNGDQRPDLLAYSFTGMSVLINSTPSRP